MAEKEELFSEETQQEDKQGAEERKKDLLKYVMSCRDEAAFAKQTRMKLNKRNWAAFHGLYDFSHKRKGQSRQILNKTTNAVEQTTSFMQQALADIGDWWDMKSALPLEEVESLAIKPEEAKQLTNYMLKKAKFFVHVGDLVQCGLLGALCITKIGGRYNIKPKFKAQRSGEGENFKINLVKLKDKEWCLKFDAVSAENYYPDPTGRGLYDVEEFFLDMHEVIDMAKGKNAIFDKDEVEQLRPWFTDEQTENPYGNDIEKPEDSEAGGHRPKVKLTEFCGNVVCTKSGKLLHENVIITVGNEKQVLRVKPNGRWIQRAPYIASPLTRVANSVWHRALMDIPTQHNESMIELFNLMLDGAMSAVHGIKQIRVNDLVKVEQVANGIPSGTTLQVKSSLPPGAKVMERVDSGDIPNDALQMYNLINSEFSASAMTNDLRMGVMPFRQVKATEVVEASQSITSTFQGITKSFEQDHIEPVLEQAWAEIAQNWRDIPKEVFLELFGQDRGEELSQMNPKEVFAATVGRYRFEVFGISAALNKSMDFRKYTTLLQTIGGSQVLGEAFLQGGYSMGHLLNEIMKSLDIDTRRLKAKEAEQLNNQQPAQGQAPQGTPNEMSQIPQAGAGSLNDILSGGAPGFPQGPQ